MIYFNTKKEAFAFPISNPIAEIDDTLWEQYAGTDRWDIIDGVFTDITDTPEWIEKHEREERERINSLNLTKADFWIALLDRSITKDMVKEKIELIPDATLRAKTLIRLDEADHFWRGDASMDIIGAMFGITPSDLDYLFEHKELPTEVN